MMESSLLLTFLISTYTICILLNNVLATNMTFIPPGVVSPHNVILEVGGSAYITCYMNPNVWRGKSSSSLYFLRDDTTTKVPATDIAFLNETAIVYMLRNASIHKSLYYCKIGEEAIDGTYILVGKKPANVTDFECRGYDFIEMECSFTAPDNMSPVEYELYYTTFSTLRFTVNDKTIYRNVLQNYRFNCILIEIGMRKVCNITLNNGYQRNQEFFNFTLNAKNDLGTNEQHFRVNNFDSVVPAMPQFEFKNITTDSVVLSWEMNNYEYYRKGKKSLMCEALWKHTNDSVWHHAADHKYPRRSKSSLLHVNLRNLSHAYYDYDVSLRIKTAASRDDFWSQACVRSFRTEAKPPDEPPPTDMGSFYINSSQDHVRLYWRKLPFSHQNGPNFSYKVQTKRDDVPIDMSPDKMDELSAVFRWHKKHRYEFLIKSQNDLGESANASRIIVPSNVIEHHKVRSPTWIRNVYDASNETYTLSWDPPADNRSLIDYTVFWCRPKQANLEECADTIDFERIKREPLFVKMSKGRSLIFAVSANYKDFSTGMHWAKCAADVAGDLSKIEPDIKALPGNAILVQWKHGTRCDSLIEGYMLKLCRVLNHNTDHNNSTAVSNKTTGECREVEIAKSENKHLLRHLKPFATYKIEMWMFSKLKVGNASDPQWIDTEEEAPTPPQNLSYSNVSSSSAWISWSPPLDPKGIIRAYTVFLNGEKLIVPSSQFSGNKANATVKYRLENLGSFTNYTVNVTAHTKKASNSSNDVHFRTLIGRPSPPMKINTQNNGESKQIRWQPPLVKSGRVEYYEVSVIRKFHDGIQHQHISIVLNTDEADGELWCDVHMPICQHANDSYEVQVRAVNVAARASEFDANLNGNESSEEFANAKHYEEHAELACMMSSLTAGMQADLKRYRKDETYATLYSEWEKGPTYGCGAPEELGMIVFLYVVLAMLFACICLLVSFFSYKKLRNMSRINIKLPGDLPQSIAGNGFDNKYVEADYSEPPLYVKSSLMGNENGPLLKTLSHDSGIGDSTPPGVYPVLYSPQAPMGYISDYCKVAPQLQLATDGYTQHCLLDKSCGEQKTIADDNYMVMSPSAKLAPLKKDDEYVHPSQAIGTFAPEKNGYVQVRPQFFSDKPQEYNSRPFSIGLSSGSIGRTSVPEIASTASGYVRPSSLALPSTGYVASHIFSTTSPTNTSYVTPKDILAMKPQMFSS